MPLSLYTMTPSGKDFIRLFSRKSLGSTPMLSPIRSMKNVEASRPRPKALTWGKPLTINNGFATEAIRWSSFKAFSQHLRETVDRKEIITVQ
jgi:hypothetical protein